MAVYKIFPTQDATLYSLFPSMNTGLDEIIEATTTTFAYSDPNPSLIPCISCSIQVYGIIEMTLRRWRRS